MARWTKENSTWIVIMCTNHKTWRKLSYFYILFSIRTRLSFFRLLTTISFVFLSYVAHVHSRYQKAIKHNCDSSSVSYHCELIASGMYPMTIFNTCQEL